MHLWNKSYGVIYYHLNETSLEKHLRFERKKMWIFLKIFILATISSKRVKTSTEPERTTAQNLRGTLKLDLLRVTTTYYRLQSFRYTAPQSLIAFKRAIHNITV